MPAPHEAQVEQIRFVEFVQGTDSNLSAEHVAEHAAHTRLLDTEQGDDSNAPVAHDVHGEHTRFVALEQAVVSYVPAEQSVQFAQPLLDEGVQGVTW